MLAGFAAGHGASEALAAAIAEASTAGQSLALAAEAGFPLADLVAAQAALVGRELVGPTIAVEVIVVDRLGQIAGRAAGW